MSVREAIIEEIKDAPEPMVREIYDFVRFLKGKASRADAEAAGPGSRPDFLARQKALFGDRVLADSQAILDEMRADRV